MSETIDTDSAREHNQKKREQEESALRKFKNVLKDVVRLLRQASGADTINLYWINKDRKQLVQETYATIWENTTFRDRMAFNESYLGRYRDITEPVILEINKDIPQEALVHYYDQVPIHFCYLIPFTNNEETVALTVLEFSEKPADASFAEALDAYTQALRNLLQTFLELNELMDTQSEWTRYEEMLERLDRRHASIKLVERLTYQLQALVPKGGVTLLCQGMGHWSTVLNAAESVKPLPIGVALEENSIVHQALVSGKPEFSIHFNGNPKRVSSREEISRGASIAVPVLVNERRQMVALIYHDNPLIFSEAVKHKVINLVRVVALRLATEWKTSSPDQRLFSNEYDAFEYDLWETVLRTEMKRLVLEPDMTTWFGFLTIKDLSKIRTRLRLEELRKLQQDTVRLADPSAHNFTGILGFYADYVYAFVLQGTGENQVEEWARSVKRKLEEPYKFGDGKQINLSVQIGYTVVKNPGLETDEIIAQAKGALSDVVKYPDALTYEYGIE
ncbi:MAG TPA: hypothetical protein VKA08_02610 [Balneolales bacterium]|nr:hypothetical protein [Balneolales bacterium]